MTSFTVLQGENVLNEGTPSDFVKQVQNSSAGHGFKYVPSTFASINGPAICNLCGYTGAIDDDIVGTCTYMHTEDVLIHYSHDARCEC